MLPGLRQLLLRLQDLNHHQASYASSAHRCSGEYALDRHNVTSSDYYQDSGTFQGLLTRDYDVPASTLATSVDANHHQDFYACPGKGSNKTTLVRHLLIGLQASTLSTGTTVHVQDATRTPALLQVTTHTRLWRSRNYSCDCEDPNQHHDSYAFSALRCSGEYALDRHNGTSSGCYQDSGTSTSICSHGIMAVRQLLRRLQRLKAAPRLRRL